MTSQQRHCPYDGRWLSRAHQYCNRESCQQRALEEMDKFVTGVVGLAAVHFILTSNPAHLTRYIEEVRRVVDLATQSGTHVG